jgi:hypothetical protein
VGRLKIDTNYFTDSLQIQLSLLLTQWQIFLLPLQEFLKYKLKPFKEFEKELFFIFESSERKDVPEIIILLLTQKEIFL